MSSEISGPAAEAIGHRVRCASLMSALPPRPDISLALVLGGGNALGAYHGGAYQALHEAGWLPDWIAGASAGALNGALISGNLLEHRVERLHEFWRPAGDGSTMALPSRSAGMRWHAGYEDLKAALATMGSRCLEQAEPGLRVFSGRDRDGSVHYDLVRHEIGPLPG